HLTEAVLRPPPSAPPSSRGVFLPAEEIWRSKGGRRTRRRGTPPEARNIRPSLSPAASLLQGLLEDPDDISIDLRGAGPYGPKGEAILAQVAFMHLSKRSPRTDVDLLRRISVYAVPELAILLLKLDAGFDNATARRTLFRGALYGRLTFPLDPQVLPEYDEFYELMDVDQETDGLPVRQASPSPPHELPILPRAECGVSPFDLGAADVRVDVGVGADSPVDDTMEQRLFSHVSVGTSRSRSPSPILPDPSIDPDQDMADVSCSCTQRTTLDVATSPLQRPFDPPKRTPIDVATSPLQRPFDPPKRTPIDVATSPLQRPFDPPKRTPIDVATSPLQRPIDIPVWTRTSAPNTASHENPTGQGLVTSSFKVPVSWTTFDRYERIAQISGGTHGKIYKARDQLTGDTVVVKWAACENGWPPNTMMREISALRHSRHSNIIYLLAVLYDTRSVGIVMAHAQQDLKTAITSMRPGTISVGIAKLYISQLLDGLRYLHETVSSIH
ncbi:hypothetical protein A4X09_0g3728, partial [Tilletia walkeri]